jgi:surface protein
MYTTENATSGTPTYTLVALDGTETALTITVDVLTIDGRTYYIHDGECFYPFLECGRYYIRINDGAYVYFSAWFDAVCEMNDIPDGYRAMRDANGCVMRDDEGEILTEECSDIPEFAPFIITIDTTKAGSANDTFVLPLPSAGTYDYYVDWGDSTGEEHSVLNTSLTHIYSSPGTYQISIRGTFPRIYFNATGDRMKLISIDQWGDIEWSSFEKSFYACMNMVGNWTDVPDLTNVTSMAYMFCYCSVFNTDISNFNTSGITDMTYLFGSCSIYNQPVNFDTSSVTSMLGMFTFCSLFNQSVSSLDTSNVLTMLHMFWGCSAFNQSVANFNTSKVQNMQRLFGSTPFNQSVANFDTSAVLDMNTMFSGCTSFKQSLATFSLTSVTNITSMLQGCDINAAGTSTNYDNTLIAWAAADVPNSLTFHGGTSKYSDAGQVARQSLIDDDLWTITADGGHI